MCLCLSVFDSLIDTSHSSRTVRTRRPAPSCCVVPARMFSRRYIAFHYIISQFTQGHDQLGESRASVLRVSVMFGQVGRIRSRCTWSGIRTHRPPHREWLEWKWSLALFDSFHRIVRYAYILRATLLLCSIGPALLGPHCLLALNPDLPIDDTLSRLLLILDSDGEPRIN